ncbi:hypothetical protein D3C73_1391510 [compost metagenome]
MPSSGNKDSINRRAVALVAAAMPMDLVEETSLISFPLCLAGEAEVAEIRHLKDRITMPICS